MTAFLAFVAWVSAGAPARSIERGIWQAAHLNNTVSVQGTLVVTRDRTSWRAQVGGEAAPGSAAGRNVRFSWKQCRCAFVTTSIDSTTIRGHWYQSPTADSGLSYASPVTLRRVSQATYAGTLHPLYDPFNFFLSVGETRGPVATAFLVNPERDLGNLWNVSGVRTDGETLALLGGKSTSDVVAEGRMHEDRTASFYFEERGGTYDFRRVAETAVTNFYPRGRPHAPYSYAPPPALDDGWRVAGVESVGMSKSGIEKFVRLLIDAPMDGPKARQIHALLIARHGKLVVEEYFHGMKRDQPHDPRSASKSITATLFGAAISAGFPISAASPVYKIMNGGTWPRNLDPRKRAMTVKSLLTMSSGWDCDDADDASPGNEETMSDKLHVFNWYEYSLALKMVRPPGTAAVYCSIQPNMVGGVLTHATHRSIPELFDELIARPMQIRRYYIPIQSNGDAFMGGGLRLIARDYMKFPQLYINGGVWNGRRVVSKRWTEQATSPLVRLKYYHDPMYGYLWWIKDFDYRGRTYRAFSMLGAGGQTFTAIPSLDLVVGFEAGDYMHHLPSVFSTYIPQYVFPAVLSGRR